eukprot:TRINITY_DN4439_c0_g2_i1.p1 TRINITY_DN4439_c0_g2~~TRINITY_DN4439_c0_g2_i1.p1  ORF type:complete len:335 (+),score=80.19 TRINITY_DN4439_c0_g2_i1:25-1029(+)
MMNGGAMGSPTTKYGQVLEYMHVCDPDYTMYEGTDWELVANSTSMSAHLFPIHPVRALAVLSSMMLMEEECKNDVLGHSFLPCVQSAYEKCGSSFINPGAAATNSSYWSNEFVPLKQGVDCILTQVFNETGFGQNDPAGYQCIQWFKKTPVYMCYEDITSKMCSGDITNESNMTSIINCLVQNNENGMMMDDCSKALSNYPSQLTASNELQYHEAFYGLVANPNGDPFATPSPAPTTAMPTASPTVTSGQSDGDMHKGRMDRAGPIAGLIVILAVILLGVFGYVFYKRRKQAAATGQPIFPCCKRSSGHTFDEVAAAEPPTTPGTQKMEEVEIR